MKERNEVSLSILTDEEVLRLCVTSRKHLCEVLETLLCYVEEDNVFKVSYKLYELIICVHGFLLFYDERTKRNIGYGTKD